MKNKLLYWVQEFVAAIKLLIVILVVSGWVGFGLYLGAKTAYNFDISLFKKPVIISVINFDGEYDE